MTSSSAVRVPAGPAPFGLMLHHLHDGLRHPACQDSFSAEDLEKILLAIGLERIVSAEEFLVASLRHPDRLQGRCCVTFDDNLRSQFDVARPILDKYGITAFFFVYTSPLEGIPDHLEVYRHFRVNNFRSMQAFYDAFDSLIAQSPFADEISRGLEGFVPGSYLSYSPFYSDEDRRFRFIRDRLLGRDRFNDLMNSMIASAGMNTSEILDSLWMDESCLKELHDEGHILGLHSHTHPTSMRDLSPAEQELEYTRNREILRSISGDEILSVSHPCNSYSRSTLDILSAMGIRLGFRATMSAEDGAPTALDHFREDPANMLRYTVSS